MGEKKSCFKFCSFLYLTIFLLTSLIAGFILSSLYASSDDENFGLEQGSVLPLNFDYSNFRIPSKTKSLPTPEIVRGIYLTTFSAGQKNKREFLLKKAKETGINTFVIDIKNSNGCLAYKFPEEKLQPYIKNSSYLIEDLPVFLAELQTEKIYSIVRIPLFQDNCAEILNPTETIKDKSGYPWRDYQGDTWLKPNSKIIWDYAVTLAKACREIGFDEIQFDYIRFPSDGNLKHVNYELRGLETRAEALEDFFNFLNEEIRKKEKIKISIDLFGFTFGRPDSDLNIGQLLSKTLPYFDFVSPMVYPSHYPNGYLGLTNPAEFPQIIIEENLKIGKKIYEELNLPFTARPWLQDFDMGASYDTTKIKSQIRACEKYGASGYIFWNAGNNYTWDGFN